MKLTIGMIAIIFSLLYSVILNILFFCKEHISTKETKIFGIIVFSNFIGLLLELACMFSINVLGTDNIITIIINKSFLLYFLFFLLIFSSYVVNVAESSKKSIGKIEAIILDTIKKIMYGLFVLSAIGVCFLEINLYGENGATYSYGASVNLVYFMAGLCVAGCFIYIITNLKNIGSSKNIPIISFLVVVGILTFVQKSHPEITIATSLETIIIFIMYHTIENPDVKMVQQLEIAKESADKANNSKTEFLSSMSHEIRTPLNAIVGFSDCIMDAKSIDEAKENAKDIVNASQTLLEIVNGILDISKIEAGKMEIVNTKYNARELFNEMAKLITPRMKEKGLDFTYSIDSNLPAMLFGDKANLKKIVTNFLSNACKYTDHGFVRYEVHSVKIGDYCRLIISVEDSGRGIKKASIDKLFTRFQRLDEDRNTTIEGTGLGLAITKQLTELMGGKVIVHTVYGQGSKFTAVINQKIESMEPEVEEEIHTNLDLTGVRILIVDDAPLNLKVATKLMQKYNADNIETCNSGFECLEKVKDGNEYDLIFLDDMMPKMSGIETFSKLKQIEGFHIPTVALTANAITGMREKYLACGFNDYLAKPMEQSELIRVCNTLLGRGKDNVVEEKVAEETEENDLEKTAVIPVPENIEEIIGDAANLDGNFKSTMAENSDIELLDDDTGAATTSNTVNLIPVADISYPGFAPTSPVIADVVSIEPEEVSEKDNSYDRKYLEDHGVDVNKALEMLGDMDMYNSTVHDFVSEVDEKWQRLHEYIESGDMENYAIDVHSLKSDCKYLGFMSLADIAYEHELKSKDKDIDFVKNHFSELEEEYNKTIELAKEYAEHNPIEE